LLFQDSDDPKKPRNAVTLSTVHKSKGREWPRVFLLGQEKYMPSKYARQAWQLEQEMNLIYVAYTRAMSELIFVPAS
jgi:DNA helicase-2/ATP-dependent DNA helicase PcrA